MVSVPGGELGDLGSIPRRQVLKQFDGVSFNGRTPSFEVGYGGSTPSTPVFEIRVSFKHHGLLEPPRPTRLLEQMVFARRKERREWLRSLKLKCVRCLESDPVCLQFHHKNPSGKELSLSLAVTNGWTKKRLLEEITKCEVLCANCHFKEHYKIV
jgi:hypothetical protein